MSAQQITSKELTIFNHKGNKIFTEDTEINVVARLEDPLIVVLGNVLSHEECDALIRLSKDRVQRSKIGTGHEVNELRTSRSMFFEDGENELITKIQKRISYIMNIPQEHAEGLQVLHYAGGQEYRPHYDYFASSTNPRISTLVIYLNDVEQGGETYFPKLHFSVNPQKGMGVYFEYFYKDMAVNELTLHGSAPVMQGEKWAATLWMRRQRLK